MKIYNVKVLRDICNNYQGTDDIELYTFDNLKDADTKMNELCINYVDKFLAENGCTEKDLEIENEMSETGQRYFFVSDGCDYIHGTIQETELKLDVYSIATVDNDPFEAMSFNQYFAYSKESADKKYETEKQDFFNMIQENELYEDETLEDFINENVRHDYEFTNGDKYFHCIYGEGKEFIINMEKADKQYKGGRYCE